MSGLQLPVPELSKIDEVPPPAGYLALLNEDLRCSNNSCTHSKDEVAQRGEGALQGVFFS